MSKVAILGSGVVGDALGDGFLRYGHDVMRGTRDPDKLRAWKTARGEKAKVGTFAEAAAFADFAVLAVKGTVAETVLASCGDALDGKVVLDATNPIADTPPVDGVLAFFTGPNDSLLERLQKARPKVRLVKAFSCVGNAFMVNPDFGGQRPTMFICGDDDDAKDTARHVLKTFGWETEDMGKSTAARAIEPLCMLWCIPGLTGRGWSHAFKMLRK
ncbi:MAG: NAD(P)-binding domain-containing protein [Polyangiaceae bacterium]